MNYWQTIGFILLLSASALEAQDNLLDRRVDFTLENGSVKECLQRLSDEYGLNFYYSDSRLPLDTRLSFEFRQTAIRDLLASVFGQAGISFEFRVSSIVLYPAEQQGFHTTGRIVDAVSGQPVAFAHIALPDSLYGSSSNENGVFELRSINRPEYLLVSHLQYKSTRVPPSAAGDSLVVRLEPAERILPGLTVRAQRDPMAYYRLILRAVRRLEAAGDRVDYAKAFYRQKSQRGGRYSEIYEIFYDVEYGANGITGWRVLEGRYALQKGDADDIFLYNRNFTLLSRIFPLLQPPTDEVFLPLNPGVRELFDLELLEIIERGNRHLAVIGFRPKEGVLDRAGSGELWIDPETAEVFKIALRFHDPSFNLIRLSDPGSSWKNYTLEYEMTFRETENGRLIPDYVQVAHAFDYYFDHNFRGAVQTSSLLAFYEQYLPPQPKKADRSRDFLLSDARSVDRAGFEPSFWRNNPVVKRTPLEEEIVQAFEKNQGFGIIFSNNRDELVFAPELTNDPVAGSILARHSLQPEWKAGRRVYLHLDRQSLNEPQEIRFRAYVYNGWTSKPDPFADVLRVYLLDPAGTILQQWSYTLHFGSASGRLVPEPALKPGCYRLMAVADDADGVPFTASIRVPGTADLVAPEIPGRSLGLRYLALCPDASSDNGHPARHILLGMTDENGIPVDFIGTAGQAEGGDSVLFASDQLGLARFAQPLPVTSDQPVGLKCGDRRFRVPDLPEEGVNSGVRVSMGVENCLEVHLTPVPGRKPVAYLAYRHEGIVRYLTRIPAEPTQRRIDLPAYPLRPGLCELLLFDHSGELLESVPVYLRPGGLQDASIELRSSSGLGRFNRVRLKIHLPEALPEAEGACYSLRIGCPMNGLIDYPASRYTTALPVSTGSDCGASRAWLRYLLDTDSLGLLVLGRDARNEISDPCRYYVYGAEPAGASGSAAETERPEKSGNRISPATRDIPVGPVPEDGELIPDLRARIEALQPEQRIIFWSDQIKANRNSDLEITLHVPKDCPNLLLHLEGFLGNLKSVSLVKVLEIR